MLSLCFLLPHLTTCCLTIMCGLGKTRSRQDALSQHAFSSAPQAETAGCLLFFSAHERVMPTAFSSRFLSVLPESVGLKLSAPCWSPTIADGNLSWCLILTHRSGWDQSEQKLHQLKKPFYLAWEKYNNKERNIYLFCTLSFHLLYIYFNFPGNKQCFTGIVWCWTDKTQIKWP